MGFARDAQWFHTGYARFSTEPGRIPHGFNSTASERELLLCILKALFVPCRGCHDGGHLAGEPRRGSIDGSPTLVLYILME